MTGRVGSIRPFFWQKVRPHFIGKRCGLTLSIGTYKKGVPPFLHEVASALSGLAITGGLRYPIALRYST